METLAQMATKAWSEGRRLSAPLVGFPGVRLLNKTIKQVQGNYQEHFQVLKQLTEDLKPDIQFILMDLSVEANALGRYTIFPLNEPAKLPRTKFDPSDINTFRDIDVTADSRIIGYAKTISLIQKELTDSIKIGAYVTGPYTLSALIMGAEAAAELTLLDSEMFTELCMVLTQKIIDYANLLIDNRVNVICVLEPSGVMLGAEAFRKYSADFVQKIVQVCQKRVVNTIYHVCGDSSHLTSEMVNSGANGLSLDCKEAGIDLTVICNQIPSTIALIGNLNPTGTILNGTEEQVESEVNGLLKDMQHVPNFILSTGCDLPLQTPFPNIKAFQKAVHGYHFDPYAS